ncbi:TPR domain protein, putative component of TonB system [uncultured Candidatus Thioglobus sp.]|nr:TPR domain protein, putative component of TonB system [uncultured Candidatus Thioglobus sp.]
MSDKDVSKMTLEELRQEYNRINEGKDYFQKVDICTRIIALDPNDANAFNNRGNAYDKLGEHQKAIEDFDKATKIKIDYASAFNNRGIVYSELGKYQKAIEDFDKAIEFKPDYASAFNNRGIVYSELGKYQKAIEDFDKAIEFKENYADALNNRGITYRELGGEENEEQAIKDFKKAQNIDPSVIAEKKIKALEEELSEDIKQTQESNREVQEFQEILEKLKSEHWTAEIIWLVVSVVAMIAMVYFLISGQEIIGQFSNTVYVFDITNVPFNSSLYMAYVFFSIITFTIIRQYTNAKALRIEASNRLAMAKMFERVKNENEEYQKEFLPKLADAIVYSTIKEKNNTGNLVDKIIDGLEQFKK